MEVTILNAVLCERIRGTRRATLDGVGAMWPKPPRALAIWLELLNPSEQAFNVAISIWRGSRFVDETAAELVLAGQRYWQMRFEWREVSQLQHKTYQFLVLVNGFPARTMVADFGSAESP
jgi:hypothetical protein